MRIFAAPARGRNPLAGAGPRPAARSRPRRQWLPPGPGRSGTGAAGVSRRAGTCRNFREAAGARRFRPRPGPLQGARGARARPRAPAAPRDAPGPGGNRPETGRERPGAGRNGPGTAAEARNGGGTWLCSCPGVPPRPPGHAPAVGAHRGPSFFQRKVGLSLDRGGLAAQGAQKQLARGRGPWGNAAPALAGSRGSRPATPPQHAPAVGTHPGPSFFQRKVVFRISGGLATQSTHKQLVRGRGPWGSAAPALTGSRGTRPATPREHDSRKSGKSEIRVVRPLYR